MVYSTILTIQNIMTELRPSILDTLGLFAAIKWLAAGLKKNSGINCRLSLPEKEPLITEEVRINIFRIMQELFTNIVRHSIATVVNVTIKEKDCRLHLRVKDNGIGITQQKLSSPLSFGLIGIRERIHAMQGTVEISSFRGKGTFVTISLPIKKTPSA